MPNTPQTRKAAAMTASSGASKIILMQWSTALESGLGSWWGRGREFADDHGLGKAGSVATGQGTRVGNGSCRAGGMGAYAAPPGAAKGPPSA